MKLFITIAFLFIFTWAALAETIEGRALWIQDGDSFILKKDNKTYNIRLWGVDAPEKGQQWGGAALNNLVRLIGRKWVKVEVVDRDRYKRYVGKVYYKGQYINLEQVKAGLAWWYEYYAPKAKDLQEAFKKAQKDKAGMWKYDDNVKPWEYRKKNRNKKTINKTN